MSKQFWSALVVMAVPLTAGLTAQQPSSSTQTTPSGSAAAGNSGQRITVSGCIERADQVTSRAVHDDVDSLTFMLIKVQKAPMANGSPVGTSGIDPHGATPGKPDVPGIGATYQLRGETNQLNQHVGQQVEITGAVTPAAVTAGTPASAGVSGGQPATAAPAPPNASVPAPVLTVSNVKMLSQTCPR